MTQRWHQLCWPIATMIVTATVAIACVFGSQAPAEPTSVITFPQPGDSFARGQEIVVQSVSAVAGSKEISRVELWVDGELAHIQAVDPPASSITASQPWRAITPGSHMLEIRAYNVDNEPGQAVQRIILVSAETATPNPSFSREGGGLTEFGENSPHPFADGPTGEPGTPAVISGDLADAKHPIVTALISLNVRSGPGVDYPPIGGLLEGESALIAGRNTEGTWWQIMYPTANQTHGWVSAKELYSVASGIETVPIVATPAPPPPPSATASPSATFAPTAVVTPESSQPIAGDDRKPQLRYFVADYSWVAPGDGVTLRWAYSQTDVAYLRYDGSNDPVDTPGTAVVTPSQTTTYTLVARNTTGTSTAHVVVRVGTPTGAPTVVADLEAMAPEAVWFSAYGANLITWSGSEDSRMGVAGWQDEIVLEDGSSLQRVLLSVPEQVANGHIAGEYLLPRPIEMGDRFRSDVGFLDGFEGEAKFVVSVSGGDLPGAQVLAIVEDTGSDGVLSSMDIDLAPAVGGTILQIGVQAGPSPEKDWTVWVKPRIVHLAISPN